MKCEKGLSFEDCELAILRAAVDKIDKQEGEKLLRNPEVKEIIKIVEEFLIIILQVVIILVVQENFKTVMLPQVLLKRL